MTKKELKKVISDTVFAVVFGMEADPTFEFEEWNSKYIKGRFFKTGNDDDECYQISVHRPDPESELVYVLSCGSLLTGFNFEMSITSNNLSTLTNVFSKYIESIDYEVK